MAQGALIGKCEVLDGALKIGQRLARGLRRFTFVGAGGQSRADNTVLVHMEQIELAVTVR